VSRVAIGIVAAVLAAIACASVWGAARHPVRWTPDALYYQARMLEIRGTGQQAALDRTFSGPISADLRAQDPQKTGNPAWVKYNEPFYKRRVAVPIAGAVLYPIAGNRSLLYISLAGYVAVVLAVFGLLLLRFRLAVAGAVAAATAVLPPHVEHSSFPLTDSWGLALEIVAFASAFLVLQRGRAWLLPWIASIALLSFVRDSTWIPILAAAWCAFRFRSRPSVELLVTGIAAALPAVFAFTTPVRDLLALLVNQSQVPPDTSWSFILHKYPAALVDLAHADAGFLRHGEWYTAAYFAGGLAALLLIRSQRQSDRTWRSLLIPAALASLAYVMAAPVFSAFRLELVFIPAVAFGLASALELAAEKVIAGRGAGLASLRAPAWIRR
jgi:hypothetical protein